MGRSRESFNKKEVRNKKEKKRKEKEKKRLERKEGEKRSGLDEMIAYVDEQGRITSTPPDDSEKEEINPEEIEVSVPKVDPDENPGLPKQGKITFFNQQKGFGFIREFATGQSIFFHINQVRGEIAEGDTVNFETEKGHRGPEAVQVTPVQPDTP